MDWNWINISAGLVTVITGIITIVNAFKPKPKEANGAARPRGKAGGARWPPAGSAPTVKPDPVNVVAGVQEFCRDDKGYQEWVTSHPQGFVVNVDPGAIQAGAGTVLHMASCGHVSNFRSRRPGAFTEYFVKVCSTDLDRLREWAKAHGRADGSFTRNCPCVHRLSGAV